MEQFPDIIPEGWSQEDILRALSNHGNVTTTGLGPVQSCMTAFITREYWVRCSDACIHHYILFNSGNCAKLGEFGGSDGSKFDDPCLTNTKITAVKIGVGALSGCPICVKYIKTTYGEYVK